MKKTLAKTEKSVFKDLPTADIMLKKAKFCTV